MFSGRLSKLSVSQRVAFVPLTVALGLLIVTLTSLTAVKGANMSAEINVAGRQRMLNQRFVKETLLASERSSSEATRTLILRSLQALREGGTLGDNTLQPPPMGVRIEVKRS